jgi:hypothetical protein
MGIAESNHGLTAPAGGLTEFFPVLAGDDPVTTGLRSSARRMISVAVFSGVINCLMLSGSLYMLQVYDRVLPSRNLATLFGLSAIVLLAYVAQGYFEALRARMLSRAAAAFDADLQEPMHLALATLPLRGAKPLVMQQPLRDLDQIRTFMSGMGPTAFLDMPWIPLFLIALFLFHPVVGIVAVLGMSAIIAMAMTSERLSQSAARLAMDSSAQQSACGCDAPKCRNHSSPRYDATADRALGAGERALSAPEHGFDGCVCKPGSGRKGSSLRAAIGHAWHRCVPGRGRQGVWWRYDRLFHHDGAGAGAGGSGAGNLEAVGRRAPGCRPVA